MSSSSSGEHVVGGRGGKDVVSSSPPAARTRAQTRADPTELNLNVISPRSTTVKAAIASAGPRRISPRGVPVEGGNSATARNELRAGSRSPALHSPVTSPTARPAPIPLHAQMISRRLPRWYCHARGVSRMQVVARTGVLEWESGSPLPLFPAPLRPTPPRIARCLPQSRPLLQRLPRFLLACPTLT